MSSDSQTLALLRKAAVLLQSGARQEAKVQIAQCLQANPDSEHAWLLLSYVVLDPAQQHQAAARALKINPGFGPAQERLTALQLPDPDKRIVKEKRAVPTRKQASVQPFYDMPAAVEAVSDAPETQAIPATEPQPLTRPGDTETVKIEPVPIPKVKRGAGNFARIAKYSLARIGSLFITVVIGVYITILVANLGGYIDEIYRGQVAQQIMGMVMGGWLDDVPEEEQDALIEQTTWQLEEQLGLHEPFFIRSLRFLFNGVTLNMGEAYLSGFFKGITRSANAAVQEMVLQRLPFTMLLVGVSNLLFFVVSVVFALFLSRHYGGILDRISVVLAALMSAPSWIYGVVLVVILAGELQWLPFPKTIDLNYAEFTPEFIKLILSQMIFPVMAIFLSLFFTGVFTWRTFFLIYSGEDYVEMAKAQGLSDRVIERRYILRPSLPYVLTSFAMLMVSMWESAIALEVLFYWPGIGSLFYQAVTHFNPTSTQVIVAIVVVFAYLLAITVFVLDIAYAATDPRVRVGGRTQKLTSASRRRNSLRFWRRKSRAAPERRPLTPIEFENGQELDAPKQTMGGGIRRMFRRNSALMSSFREIAKYPSAVVGFVIILVLVGISIYTVFAIPYDQAISLWQTHNPDDLGRTTWYQYPHTARPEYVNYFRRDKLPETIIRDSRDETISKVVEPSGEDATEITYSFVFDFPYSDFPDEIVIYFESEFDEKSPHISMTWVTPDGREIRLGPISPERGHRYTVDQDERLEKRLRGVPIIPGLLGDPEQDHIVPLKGTYELQVSSVIFEPEGSVEAEMVLYGQVAGLAGTDNQRRDLSVALLWGTPVALAFGFMGAVVTSLISMLIAAVGSWYGGWVDEVIQRITDVNIILPTLPVAIMVSVMYSKSIWAILGVIVLLNIFGSSIKNYRSVFMQVKEAGYIEGALAYGAGNWRIIMRYLVPRIIPVLIPQLVIMVPGFVFIEATLAYLGLSDPQLPTWGKVIYDAITNGAHQGLYYWILQPIGLLVLTGLAFALLGFALDRVVNPRLRDI